MTLTARPPWVTVAHWIIQHWLWLMKRRRSGLFLLVPCAFMFTQILRCQSEETVNTVEFNRISGRPPQTTSVSECFRHIYFTLLSTSFLLSGSLFSILVFRIFTLDSCIYYFTMIIACFRLPMSRVFLVSHLALHFSINEKVFNKYYYLLLLLAATNYHFLVID